MNPKTGLPYHEWYVEFKEPPANEAAFAENLEEAMQKQNSYYKDLVEGKVLKPLIITKVREGGFRKYMKSEGKLGGQNKPPRLSNNRKLANSLTSFLDDRQ